MAKRGSNIYKRKDGRYEGRIKIGKNESGRYRYIYVYDKTLAGVKKKLEESLQKHPDTGEACQLTVKTVLLLWLEGCRDNWKSTTYAAYRQLAEKAIFPYSGDMPAAKLDEAAVERLLKALKENAEKQPLSQGYQKHICILLRQAFTYVKKTYHYNLTVPELPVFRSSTAPIKKLPEESCLERLDTYLRENASEDTCLGILLAKYTGIRIGELCALQWKDINLSDGTVCICGNLQRVKTYEADSSVTKVQLQTPKTDNSARILPIPDSIRPLLEKYEGRPEQYILAGQKYPWTEARTIQYRFAAILRKLELPQFNFHMLRHSFASTCIRRGCDMKSLSEMLGHSSIQITMNLYVHTSIQQKRDAVNKVFADF